MRKFSGRKLVIGLAVCALGLSAIAAAPGSAGAPQALQNERPVSGVLTGNGGGAFAYYTVNYPGDESVVTLEMRYNPADPVTTSAVGFNVYGVNGHYIGPGMQVADTGGDGLLQLEYADTTAATWLIQVYNYLPDVSIGYTLMAEGLPVTTATTTAALAATTTPETVTTTAPAAPLTGSGYLLGNAGGAYAMYQVTVLEDGSDVEVTLNWSPDDPVISTGVGFVAYGPDGQIHQATGTGTPGERSTTLPADQPGVYRIQVYNYIDGLNIRYALHSAAAE